MNILFICGSLEQGRNGVGDYTRIIGSEIAKRGNKILLIAFNDNYISDQQSEVSKITDVDLTILRLPSRLDERKRYFLLKQTAGEYKPDLISLQYVPYSYSSLGIPLLLGKKMKQVYTGCSWHVMVHEPYLGSIRSSKEYFIQSAQKISLFFLMRSLRPRVVHTSIKEYQKLLSNIFIKSKLLGLFGNIPVYSYSDCKKSRNTNSAPKKNKYSAVYFGAPPKLESHSEVANKIKSFCEKTGIFIHLTICGKSSSLANSFAGTIKEECGDNCQISLLGELSETELSKIFCSSDFGIARTPPKFLGKSGSSMAMLEHNLPLWIPLNNDEPLEQYMDFQIDLCFYKIEKLGTIIRSRKIQPRPLSIANTMLQDLQYY